MTEPGPNAAPPRPSTFSAELLRVDRRWRWRNLQVVLFLAALGLIADSCRSAWLGAACVIGHRGSAMVCFSHRTVASSLIEGLFFLGGALVLRRQLRRAASFDARSSSTA